jgi:hypothetical protein
MGCPFYERAHCGGRPLRFWKWIFFYQELLQHLNCHQEKLCMEGRKQREKCDF